MVALAVVMGTGLAQAFGNVMASSTGVPLAVLSGTLDPSAWTTPVSSLSFARLSDGRQRLGKLLALAPPRLDGRIIDTAGATAAILALILLRLLARQAHGGRAPPCRTIPVSGAVWLPTRRRRR
jgi:hypothetical protein